MRMGLWELYIPILQINCWFLLYSSTAQQPNNNEETWKKTAYKNHKPIKTPTSTPAPAHVKIEVLFDGPGHLLRSIVFPNVPRGDAYLQTYDYMTLGSWYCEYMYILNICGIYYFEVFLFTDMSYHIQ